MMQLHIQHIKLWPIWTHCLETEFGACRQSSNCLHIGLYLSPLDPFFWGATKGEVYKEKPCSLKQLKQAVEAFKQSVSTNTRCCIIENFAVCISPCANRNGVHSENVNYMNFVWVFGILMHIPNKKVFPIKLF